MGQRFPAQSGTNPTSAKEPVIDRVPDVLIVGAGPGGATCAYDLARLGHTVTLVDRCRFPRDKICGDAVVPRAQRHLARMGALARLIGDGKARPALVGGFTSPGGLTVLGRSRELIDGEVVYSIKRFALDHEIVRAAAAAGANLLEECSVDGAQFDPRDALWRVETRTHGTLKARALVAADGANSHLARSLGLVQARPTAVCSRAYVAAGTHRADLDGICFYRRHLLPGYAALFREADDDLNFCCYILPGGPVQPARLRELHDGLLRDDPDLRRLLGGDARIERMHSAPLRVGGIRRSYEHALLVVGDAAGHIDPLTGEGIQYAMDAGELAARTLAEALAAGDLSSRALRRYQQRWQRSFGRDFAWSQRCAMLMARYPRLLDAAAVAIRRNGQGLLKVWAGIMTGGQPKSHLLRPGVVWPMTLAVLRGGWRTPQPA